MVEREVISRMVKMVVDEIRRLSQEEGLSDVEIAQILGISRVTVCRVRKQYGIPRANRANRKDKVYVCAECKREIAIARKERKQRYCPECKAARELMRNRARREARRNARKPIE